MNPSLNVVTVTFKEILPKIIYLRINIRPHHNLYIFNLTLRVVHALALKFYFILNPDLCMYLHTFEFYTTNSGVVM